MQFLGKDNLCINKLTTSLLKDFMDYLVRKREEKVRLLMKQGKRVPSNRVVSLYLGSIRHLFNEARKQYNDYDRDMILISHSPFDNFKIPKQEATRKRAISAELIKKIYKLPYRYNSRGKEIKGRYNLAKDGFIMSFCLIGMNTADLYNCKELDYGVITYYRTKTTSRRNDKAKMKVKVPALIMSLFELVKMKTYISLRGIIGKFFIICIANDKFCIHEKLSILNVGSKIISAVTDSNDYYWHNLKFTIYYQK